MGRIDPRTVARSEFRTREERPGIHKGRLTRDNKRFLPR